MQSLNCILLIDDDPVTNYLHADLITSLLITGQILIAKNGKEGLQLAQQGCSNGEAPALILVDINMPVMDGFAFLEAYTQKLENAPSPTVVAVVSTTVNPKDIDRVAKFNKVSLLNKPLEAEHLYTLAQSYWQQKGETNSLQ